MELCCVLNYKKKETKVSASIPKCIKFGRWCKKNGALCYWNNGLYLCDKTILTDQIPRMLHMLYQIVLVSVSTIIIPARSSLSRLLKKESAGKERELFRPSTTPKKAPTTLDDQRLVSTIATRRGSQKNGEFISDKQSMLSRHIHTQSSNFT